MCNICLQGYATIPKHKNNRMIKIIYRSHFGRTVFLSLLLISSIKCSNNTVAMKTKYVNNPDLEMIKDNYKGNRTINGKFVNENETKEPYLHWKKILKWQFVKNPYKQEKKSEKYQLDIAEDKSFLTNNDDVIIWFGHSSFFIRMDGITIFTDPCFTDIPVYKRKVGVPNILSEIRNLDYILISHGHNDHFDEGSLKQLVDNNPGVSFLIPLRMGTLIEKMFPKNQYQEAGWYQKYNVEKIGICFLPAKHWHMRGMFDFNKVLWGSFYIKGKNSSIYFAGDTAFGDHFLDIREIFKQTDICIMPIGAYKPRFVMDVAHITPTESVMAANQLNSSIFIPMHYGTYDLADEPLSDPINAIHELNNSAELNNRLMELKVGELFYF